MNLKSALATFNQYIHEEVRSISYIKLGITNFNYKITTNENIYVLRMPKKDTESFFNRKLEKKIIKLIEPLDIDVPLVIFDENTGVKITKYIKHSYFNKKNHYLEIASTIKSIHSIKIDSLNLKFDLLENYNKFISSIRKIYFKPFKTKIILNFIREELKNNNELVLCHNDLVPNNFLYSKKKIYIIDYEYANINHYMFDIASFITENNIDDEQERLEFFQAYFKDMLSETIIKRLNFWILFLDLYWTRWANMMYCYYHEEIYYQIGVQKFTRYSINSSKLFIE